MYYDESIKLPLFIKTVESWNHINAHSLAKTCGTVKSILWNRLPAGQPALIKIMTFDTGHPEVT